MNIIAIFHAYKFTHFDTTITNKTKDATHLSFGNKLKTLILGINNPRPQITAYPNVPFKTIRLQSNKSIECWLIKTGSSKGTVILFHGYSGEKSSMLDKAKIFLNLGYNTLLVDFMGSGHSEGNQTTIGFYEAKQVETSYNYLKQSGEQNIILFGTSMGAVAIMKFLNDTPAKPNGIIIECPFGSMLQTVQARFITMHVPTFPMSNLLVFWGGIENNFNAFYHTPTNYAKQIKCPVLLMYGQKDNKVSRIEIDSIYKNLQGKKSLKLYPLAGHENYIRLYKTQWTTDIASFLNGLQIIDTRG